MRATRSLDAALDAAGIHRKQRVLLLRRRRRLLAAQATCAAAVLRLRKPVLHSTDAISTSRAAAAQFLLETPLLAELTPAQRFGIAEKLDEQQFRNGYGLGSKRFEEGHLLLMPPPLCCC